jgi:transcriptional regulator with XRE-family HTH domain
MRQNQLAKIIGIDGKILSGFETGRMVPTPAELDIISKALNVPPEELWREGQAWVSPDRG